MEYLDLSKRITHVLFLIVSKIESHEIVHEKLFKTVRYALQSIVYDVIKLRLNTTSTTCLDQILDYTSDALCYLGDFQVCLQNLAYGDVFTKITSRAPIDKNLKVIEDDANKLKILLNYFKHESNWGVNCDKYENKAREKFSS